MKTKAYFATEAFFTITAMRGFNPVTATLLLPLALILRSVSGELLYTH